MAYRHQAITWTWTWPNVHQNVWQHMVSLGHNELSWVWNILETLHDTMFTDALAPCVTNTSPAITQCFVLFCYTNEFENTVNEVSAIFILASMCYSRQAHDWSPYHLTITADLTGPGLFTWTVNTLRQRENGRHFADDTFKNIFVNENARISIKISLKFVPKGSVNNITALVQIMAWRCPGDKPLSEPMMVSHSAPMS